MGGTTSNQIMVRLNGPIVLWCRGSFALLQYFIFDALLPYWSLILLDYYWEFSTTTVFANIKRFPQTTVSFVSAAVRHISESEEVWYWLIWTEHTHSIAKIWTNLANWFFVSVNASLRDNQKAVLQHWPLHMKLCDVHFYALSNDLAIKISKSNCALRARSHNWITMNMYSICIVGLSLVDMLTL